jgi:hypothetical protein
LNEVFEVLNSREQVYYLPEEYKDISSVEVLNAVKVFSNNVLNDSASAFEKGRALWEIKESKEIIDWLDFTKKAFNLKRAMAYKYIKYYVEFKDQVSKIIEFNSWIKLSKFRKNKSEKVAIRKLKKDELRVQANKLKEELKFKSVRIKNLEHELVELKRKQENEKVIVKEIVKEIDYREELGLAFKEINEDNGDEVKKIVNDILDKSRNFWNLSRQVKKSAYQLKEFGTSEIVKKVSNDLIELIRVSDEVMFRK